MGWRRKIKDPVSAREQTLREEIERLEAQIHDLSTQAASPAPPRASARDSARLRPEPPARRNSALSQRTPQPGQLEPRVRSTVLPGGQTAAKPGALPHTGAEQVFEAVDHTRLEAPAEAANRDLYNDLGVRKYDLPTAWQRLRSFFQASPTQNQTFVKLLAAGNIQGLRPLRYEKRVARRRFIMVVILLFLLLWGIFAKWLLHR
jgi:hypothetical protein